MGPEKLAKALGAEIRRRRTNLAISQEELAARSGLHRTYVGAVERGERNLTVRNLVRISSALGCRTSDLLRGAEELPPARRGRT